MTPKAPRFLKINSVLFTIATGISLYLIWHHYALINGDAGFGSFCSVNEKIDCDVVNTSEYSEFLGIPLGTWAFGYYALAIALSLLGALCKISRKEALATLLPLSAMSVVVSVVTFSITALVLKTFCLMCASLQILNLITFTFTFLAFKDFGSLAGAKPKKILGYAVTGAIVFLIAQAVSSNLERQMPLDTNAFATQLMSIPPVDVPPGDSPRMGFMGDNPKIRLVEFADFQCPACAMAAKQMHRLIKRYASDVQLVFKNFPLDSSCNPHITTKVHDKACLAARAGLCAHKGGAFKEYYQKLFAHQRELTPDNLRAWAVEGGLNLDTFNACLDSPETALALQKDTDLGNSVNLASTPTFFVNGRKIEGVIDEQKLRVILKILGK